MLSLFVTGGERDDIFWRSSISGGRSTVAGKGKLAHVAGDICAVHPLGAHFISKFFVECKHYRDMQVGQAFMTRSGRLLEFWRIAVEKAAELNKQPLLIFKQNRSPVMVAGSVLAMDELDWIAYAAMALSERHALAGGGTLMHRDQLCLDHADAVFAPDRIQPGGSELSAVPKKKLRGKRE